MTEAIIGLDVGTTVTKAVLFDLSGNELLVAAQSYQLRTPRPGWVELDPDDIWRAVLRVLRMIVAQAPPELSIRAIALATQGGTLIPCRADGSLTGRAITWMDRRSGEIVDRWRASGVADRVRQISGWSPEAGLPLVSIVWLREACPEVFGATELFLSVNDYVAGRLTGTIGTNRSMAGEMLLADVATGEWSDELCNLAGIALRQLSPILPSVASLGNVRPDVARVTGLTAQAVVINGAQDHSSEALALGLTSRGDGLLACGTAWVINCITREPAIDSIPDSMCLNHHALPGRWVASQFLGGIGACLRWWLDQCAGRGGEQQGDEARDQIWATFNAALGETAAGCSGLLYAPQTGSRRGADSVDYGGFVGLHLGHSRVDMGRAIMEAGAYELRWALDQLAGSELEPRRIWMVGGATQSPLWPQIVADVTGVPVSLTQYAHGPALGAAILAGLGLAVFGSVEEALAAFPVSARQIVPGDSDSEAYETGFAAYQEMSRMLVQ